MAQVTLKMVAGDTGPDRNFTIKREDGTVVDVTGATVLFKIKENEAGITNADHQECSIVDGPAGKVSYEFEEGDIPNEGVYYCDLEITFADGEIETAPDYVIINARAQV